MKSRTILAVFLTLGCLVAGAPVRAQNIVAVVNGQIVTDYDVAERQRLLALSSSNRPSGGESVLNELVDERLKMQEATKLKINVTDAQVDRAFTQIAERSHLSAADFTNALASRGVDAKTLRDRLRAELAWQQVVQMKARALISVRDEDIADALKERGQDPENIKGFEFELVQAVVFVPKNSPPALVAERKKQAEAFHSSINGCANIKDRAHGFKDAVARDPIRRNGNELTPAMRTILEKAPVGRPTQIQQSDLGFEFVVVCGKKEISGRDGATSQMRIELMTKQMDQAGARLLRDLRQKASIDYRKK